MKIAKQMPHNPLFFYILTQAIWDFKPNNGFLGVLGEACAKRMVLEAKNRGLNISLGPKIMTIRIFDVWKMGIIIH